MLPSGATAYSFTGQHYPSVVVRGRTTPVKQPVRRSGALVSPTSCTYSLVGPTGSLLVDAAACTIVSSIATYSILSSSVPATTSPGEGYQERWVFVIAGETIEILRPAAVVAAPLYPVISDADIEAQYNGLSQYLTSARTTWQDAIDEAWGELMAALIRKGRLPYCIRTPDALREAHLHKSMHLIFQGFGVSGEGEHWRKQAATELLAYKDALQECTVQLDQDQDKLVDQPDRRDMAQTPAFFSPAVGQQSSVWSRV